MQSFRYCVDFLLKLVYNNIQIFRGYVLDVRINSSGTRLKVYVPHYWVRAGVQLLVPNKLGCPTTAAYRYFLLIRLF